MLISKKDRAPRANYKTSKLTGRVWCGECGNFGDAQTKWIEKE